MKTRVGFLLDRSGSMSSVLDETINAFNAYLEELGDEPDIEFTWAIFDSISMDVLCKGVNPKNAPRLNKENYKPRDYTPLHECSIKMIEAIAALPTDGYRPPVIVVQTDGHENSSGKEYDLQRLKSLIDAKTKDGWQFIFMGCGFDNYDAGMKMGYAQANTMSHGLSGQHMSNAYRSTASNVKSYVSGAKADASFDSVQKEQAGDVHDPMTKKPVPPMAERKRSPGGSMADFSLKD